MIRSRIVRVVDGLPSIVWWVLLVAWAGLIFWLSSLPDLTFVSDPLLDYPLRKAGHAGIFGVLGGFAYLACGRSWRWALLIGSAYAALDEIHQGFTANRTPFVGDVLIDIVGVLVALFVLRRLLGLVGRDEQLPADDD